jgi:hypothetical protein
MIAVRSYDFLIFVSQPNNATGCFLLGFSCTTHACRHTHGSSTPPHDDHLILPTGFDIETGSPSHIFGLWDRDTHAQTNSSGF